MELIADTKNTQIIAKHFETYFNIGKTLHMMCNSSGCNWGGINCKTIEYHDEL
jgi:hypothetical protein